MNDQPIDLGKGDASKLDNSSTQAQAASALRAEYVSGRAGNTGGTAAPGDAGSLPGGDKSISANEQRMAQERTEFLDRYEKQNVDLGPIKKGWGPYQALQEMVKDHKIDLDDKQLLDESRRIRDRDFSGWGRNYYSATDKTSFWSKDEIDRKVEDKVERVKGIDVYSGNKDIDWKQVKDAGYQFAFLKASEGITIADDHLQANRTGAQDAGLRIGYYHYFRPNDSVDAQVKNFVTAVGKPDANALRLVVDLEEPKIWKPYSVPQRVKMIDDWCKGVTKALGVTPTVSVYGSPDFFNTSLKNSPTLGKYDLWLADYNTGEPPVPKPWSNWTFFQYSEHGKVPGIKTDVDLDMYMGSDLDKAMAPNRKK